MSTAPDDDLSRFEQTGRVNRGAPDFARARMAWFSVEGAVGNHCVGKGQPCAVCTALEDLRLALEAETEQDIEP